MKRLLIGAVVVIVLVVFGGNFFYARQVEKQLDELASTLQMMGGDLVHDGVAISLGGDVQINDLLVFAPGFGEQLRIDRVVLRTGSIVGVHWLAADFRNSRLPVQLGLSIEGLRLPTGGENYRQLDLLNEQGGESVSTAGCGDRKYFSALDLIKMGYSELVVDTHLDYRILDDGDVIEISGHTRTQDMHNLSASADLQLGARSRDLSAMGTAMAGAQLQSLTIDYEDLGYTARVLEFCQNETGLSRSEFLALHLEAWQEAWQDKGFVAGPNMVMAYQQFLAQPGHLGVSINPSVPFSLMQMVSIPPELLIYQLQAGLWINQAAAGGLDLTVMDDKASAARQSRKRDQELLLADNAEQEALVLPDPDPVVEEEAQADARLPVRVRDLRSHRGSYVELNLANGRKLEGRVHQVEEESLRLQQFQSGGYLIVPVGFADIVEAYLIEQ
jgi:hypothetical protein